MARTKPTGMAARPIRMRVLLLAAFLLLLYVIVPQIDAFSESFSVVRRAAWGPALAALVLVVCTYVVATGIYQLLALRRLSFRPTFHVQGASAFANRILPAGLGGLTLNVQYLRHRRHTAPQAIVVAGTTNTLGFVGHMTLLGIALLLGGNGLVAADTTKFTLYGCAGIAILLIAGVVLLIARRLRERVWWFTMAIFRQFAAYRHRKLRLVLALCCSIALTLLYVGIFYLSVLSVGESMSFLQAFIIFTAGMLVGTVTPTPGGLGGVEAGLLAGGVAYGLDASAALAAALLYRLLTYWLPLIPGFILFMTGRKLYS